MGPLTVFSHSVPEQVDRFVVFGKFPTQFRDSLIERISTIEFGIPLIEADTAQEEFHLFFGLEIGCIEVSGIPVDQYSAEVENKIPDHSSAFYWRKDKSKRNGSALLLRFLAFFYF